MTLIHPIVPTLVFASIPPQPQQKPTLAAKASGEGENAQKKGIKDKAPPANLAPPKLPNPIPLCALCDVVGHDTNNFPKLPNIKNVVSNIFPDSNIPEVLVFLPESAKKNRSLRKNQPCAFCNNYGHYSHRCPCPEYFRDTLQVLREL